LKKNLSLIIINIYKLKENASHKKKLIISLYYVIVFRHNIFKYNFLTCEKYSSKMSNLMKKILFSLNSFNSLIYLYFIIISNSAKDILIKYGFVIFLKL